MPLRLLLLLALLVSCGGDPPADAGSPLGAATDPGEALQDDATMTQGLALARSVIFGGEASDDLLTALPGRRAFVCAYQVAKPRQACATGVGKDLAASIKAAATSFKAQHDGFKDGARLKLDVVTRTVDKAFNRAVEKPKKRYVGAFGMWVDHEGQISWVLPSEMLERHIFNPGKGVRGIERKRVIKELKKRNKTFGDLPEEFPYTRLYTAAWIEVLNLEGGVDRAEPLYRTHHGRFAELSPDLMLQRIVWAADYLISSISPEGKIRYNFRVVQDNDSRSYNLLRHGGTTYSILQAYDRTKHEPYRLASEQALEYLFEKTRRDVREGPKGPFGTDQGESIWILSPGKKVKLGGAGLALVAINQYVESTGDTEKYREWALGFGRFLVASMKDDGEFIYFPALEPGGPPTSKDGSEYYPGEAILGLVRLYSWDRNPLWLETAKAGADWLIDVRDKGKNEKRLANDHWLMLALSYLYHYTQDPRYLEHSLNLSKAVEHQYEKNRPTWKGFWDYQGGYYDPPRSTPAATRGEGLGAVVDTCRIAEKDCRWVRFLLEETIRHELLSQYDDVTSYWMKRPARAFGGWNGGLLDMDVRNDFVQHNMSATIGLERSWRLEQNETLPGGPGWIEGRLDGTKAFTGVPAEQMETLQAWSRTWRGENHWDELWAKQQADKAPAETP